MYSFFFFLFRFIFDFCWVFFVSLRSKLNLHSLCSPFNQVKNAISLKLYTSAYNTSFGYYFVLLWIFAVVIESYIFKQTINSSHEPKRPSANQTKVLSHDHTHIHVLARVCDVRLLVLPISISINVTFFFIVFDQNRQKYTSSVHYTILDWLRIFFDYASIIFNIGIK